MQIIDRKTVAIPGPSADASPALLAAAKAQAKTAVEGEVARIEAQLGDLVDAAVAGRTAATSGSTLTGYGPSYMVGVRSTKPSKSFFSLVAAGAGFGSARNRAVSGATAVENAYDALTGINGFKWTPLVDGGIVLIEPNINCAQLFGGNPKGYAAALNATRVLTALVRSRARIPADSPEFTYSGSWRAAEGIFNGGTIARATTEQGATATFSFIGSEATIVLHAKDGTAPGTVYGPIEVSVDGGPWETRTLTDQAIDYTPSSAGTRYGATISVAPYPVRVWGLRNAPHTIRIRNISEGRGIVIREALLPAANPPGVVLIADAPRPDWSSSEAGGSNAVLANYNRLLWQVADEFGGPITVVDPTPGWDNATMSDVATNDGKHPSDLGHAHYAEAILPRVRALGWSPAWSGWKSGDGYAYASPPPALALPGDYVSRYRASSLTGNDGASVTSWPDEGPAGVPFTGSNAPTLRTTGRRRVEFDGTNDALARPAANASARTRFIVGRIRTLTEGTPQLLTSATVARTLIIGRSAAGTWTANNGTSFDSGTAGTTDTVVIGVVFDGANSLITINGEPVVTGDSGASATPTNEHLGRSSTGDVFPVDVEEVIHYSRAMTATELRGAALKLKADHGL